MKVIRHDIQEKVKKNEKIKLSQNIDQEKTLNRG